MTSRASSSTLTPGEHSIDRVRAKKLPNGGVRITWRICLPDGTVLQRHTYAPTVAEARRRARAKAEEIQSKYRSGGQWSTTTTTADYLDSVTKPLLEKITVTNTRNRYLLALRQLTAQLGRHDIAVTTRFRTLEKALQAIAQEHGSESARQARSVLSKYVLDQMVRDELIPANPLRGVSIDLSSTKQAPPRAERALTAAELKAAVDYLLGIDPAEGVEKPIRGRWTLADAIEKRRCSIDLALLQAASGLRIAEANALTWETFDHSAEVTAATSKTRRGRVVPLLWPDVIEHLHERRARGGRYVIGSPANPDKQWNNDNARKANATLYPEIGEAIGCPEVFEHGRSHLWRKTLNSNALGVPADIRAAFFGHDVTTNRAYYTDATDLTPLLNAAQRIR